MKSKMSISLSKDSQKVPSLIAFVSGRLCPLQVAVLEIYSRLFHMAIVNDS